MYLSVKSAIGNRWHRHTQFSSSWIQGLCSAQAGCEEITSEGTGCRVRPAGPKDAHGQCRKGSRGKGRQSPQQTALLDACKQWPSMEGHSQAAEIPPGRRKDSIFTFPSFLSLICWQCPPPTGPNQKPGGKKAHLCSQTSQLPGARAWYRLELEGRTEAILAQHPNHHN